MGSGPVACQYCPWLGEWAVDQWLGRWVGPVACQYCPWLGSWVLDQWLVSIVPGLVAGLDQWLVSIAPGLVAGYWTSGLSV